MSYIIPATNKDNIFQLQKLIDFISSEIGPTILNELDRDLERLDPIDATLPYINWILGGNYRFFSIKKIPRLLNEIKSGIELLLERINLVETIDSMMQAIANFEDFDLINPKERSIAPNYFYFSQIKYTFENYLQTCFNQVRGINILLFLMMRIRNFKNIKTEQLNNIQSILIPKSISLLKKMVVLKMIVFTPVNIFQNENQNPQKIDFLRLLIYSNKKVSNFFLELFYPDNRQITDTKQFHFQFRMFFSYISGLFLNSNRQELNNFFCDYLSSILNKSNTNLFLVKFYSYFF